MAREVVIETRAERDSRQMSGFLAKWIIPIFMFVGGYYLRSDSLIVGWILMILGVLLIALNIFLIFK